jgi:glycosyltransferase involved in cell wall biosynthesis
MHKVSVVMPVYLGHYKGCAEDREEKFVRAINSFLNNDYENKELIIIGDCCLQSENILKDKFHNELISHKIKFYNMPKKQKLFSGKLRTIGLDLCEGKYIMYLDSDDMFGDKHISNVYSQLEFNQLHWCYYNDFLLPDGAKLIKKEVELEHGSIGTSSIAHINTKRLNWRWCNGYGHDWKFVKKLIRFSNNYEKIYGATYIICHIPDNMDN